MSRLTTAVFGCGCFWTKEHLFGQLHGVVSTRVGFMGGWTIEPTYRQVCEKTTGHAEVVEVTYDSELTRFPTILKAFFSFHDATRDRSTKGGQYRSVVFYRKAKERVIAERAVELLREHGLEITTRIEPAKVFWPAEERHQRYVARTGLRAEASPSQQLESMTLEEAAVVAAA